MYWLILPSRLWHIGEITVGSFDSLMLFQHLVLWFQQWSFGQSCISIDEVGSSASVSTTYFYKCAFNSAAKRGENQDMHRGPISTQIVENNVLVHLISQDSNEKQCVVYFISQDSIIVPNKRKTKLSFGKKKNHDLIYQTCNPPLPLPKWIYLVYQCMSLVFTHGWVNCSNTCSFAKISYLSSQ